MKISYAAHQEIDVSNGKPTVIATNNPVAYHDLVSGIQNDSNVLKCYSDDYEDLETEHVIDWVGDVGIQSHLDDRYNLDLLKHLATVLTDDQRKSITDINNQLYTLIQQCLFMIDLPLEVTYDWDLKKLFKYCKIHFNSESMKKPYAIMESIIKVHLECGIKSVVGLTNVAHYLNQQQIQDLFMLIKATGIPTLLIEFTDMKQKKLYANSDFYYIDEDFVDWHV
ncbi:type II-A CRISPR-associated protein Csn2 [Liquorilactobacillus nagelii]|jgi:CRISPR type II-A-associated protein Csn2|uniref:type II-A CRISPR-associated protein Csn2 n=1 Tax=Liquorilactobacillus nagelii TaxID=82688 RepID=UPI001CC93438|nr:type II-A CRISPR-associated protein Csn2 [Liquorilactobacillus nagelii]ULQ49134.1 type II-A CRISPR-associated protein Csn2 [Liquorilactobacillus nagelii]